MCISKKPRYAKQKQPRAVKKGMAKQSRIKSIEALVRVCGCKTKNDIRWWPSGLVRPRTDIRLRPSGLIRAEPEIAVGHWPFSDQFQDLAKQK